MKKNKFIYIIIISFFLLLAVLVNCYPPKKPKGKPNIYHLLSNYYGQFYVFDNFQDNEESIKYLINFSRKQLGRLVIVTDKNTYRFEDGFNSLEDNSKQQFLFFRMGENLKNTSITINYLKKIPIKLQNEQGKEVKPYEPPVIKVSATDYEEEASKINSKTLSLYYNFETLNLNILQNLFDFAEQDKEKKEIDTYIYELYNKDKEKKVVITYHDKGEWFEVEII